MLKGFVNIKNDIGRYEKIRKGKKISKQATKKALYNT
jgi:hypothetical protein